MSESTIDLHQKQLAEIEAKFEAEMAELRTRQITPDDVRAVRAKRDEAIDKLYLAYIRNNDIEGVDLSDQQTLGTMVESIDFDEFSLFTLKVEGLKTLLEAISELVGHSGWVADPEFSRFDMLLDVSIDQCRAINKRGNEFLEQLNRARIVS